MTLKNKRAHFLCYIKLWASFQTIVEFKLELQSGNTQLGSNRRFFGPCDHEILWITLKANRAPLLRCLKLCASFRSHRWIQTKVTVHKTHNSGQNQQFIATSKFDGWPWESIGHLFYATVSFVHHFVAIGEFKLELQSGNAQFWSKSTTFLAVWSWNLTDDLEKQ